MDLVCPSRRLAAALRAVGRRVKEAAPAALPAGATPALVLGDDELSRAGEHAEGLIAEAARVLLPGGMLLASARNPLLLAPGSGLRGFSSQQLSHALSQRGFTLEVRCAPGAAARLLGRDGPGYDPHLDRVPGLLDAGPMVVAVARSPVSPAARSAVFLDTLPRKVVAAAVLCRDAKGRLLVVHDVYRGSWTVPGGVVDADEDPQTGAVREAYEEAGIAVDIGPLLGVFSSPWPDRVLFLYAAAPQPGAGEPRPLHAHEVDEARWVPLDLGLQMVNGRTRWQLDRCLTAPGGTWRQ